MTSDREAELLVTGAKVGIGYVPIYIEFLRGFEGQVFEMAKLLDMTPTMARFGIMHLKELKLIHIARWATSQQAVYAIGDKPDAKQPQPKRLEKLSKKQTRIEKAQMRLDRLLEQAPPSAVAAAQKFKETRHGSEVQNGAVRTHRMR